MDEMQGVMSLPEAQGPGMRPEDMAIFEEIRRNVPRQEITKEFLDAGEQADPQAVAEFKQELAGLELTPDELNKLNTMVDAILAAPQDYASLRRAYLAEGMPEDLLPEQFDPAFFAALNMAIDTIAMNPGPRPPMAMARGGVADLAAYGRNGDTMLAHITPQEAAMLKRMGGSGTINPYTGLPEYGNVFKSIGKAAKKFAKSTVGKVLIGAGLAIFAGPAAASFLGVTSTAGMAAVSGFVGGAGSTLAAGGGLKNALKAGAMSALLGGATAAISGGAAAFEPRVLGGQNPNVFGFGQPEVVPSTGVGTAAEIAATPPVVENPMGIDVRPSPPAPLADSRFGAQVPLDSGSLTAADMTGPVAQNTGAGVYSPQRQFTPAAGTGTAPSGGIMNTLREGYGKVENFYDKYISPDRYANDPTVLAKAAQAGEAAQSSAFNTAYNRAQLMLPENATATQLEAAKGLAFQAGQDAYKTAYDKALQGAMPGGFTRYAPLAALGIGALGLAGGFKTKDATPPDMAMFRGPSLQQLAAARLNYGGIRPTAYGGYYSMPGYAEGGGVMDTPQAMRVGGKTYPRKTGAINGPGTGTSDSIPAMLSDGEFVFTAKAVRAMGNGSRRKGAKKMYQLMKMLEGKAA
jgi:hypothetical protein